MVTWGVFGCWTSYLRERLPLVPFAPLILVLLVAAGGSFSSVTWGAAVLAATWAICLVGAFRLWDDLVDRELDRRRGLHRTLVLASDLRPFYALLATLFTAALALAVPSGSVLRVTAIAAALGLWYSRLRPRHPNPVLHTQLLLLKYPAFVYLLSRQLSDGPPWLGMTLVYAGLTLYEHMEASWWTGRGTTFRMHRCSRKLAATTAAPPTVRRSSPHKTT